jgi:hypothetical protein
MIEITCPQCGEVYHADAFHVGKRIRCIKCSSVLPILGAGSTTVQKPPEANGVRPSQLRPEARSAASGPRRNSFGLASIVVPVVVITVGLLILLYSRLDKGATSVFPTGPGVPLTSSETDGTKQESSMNPDSLPVQARGTGSNGPPCDEHQATSHNSTPNGSRIIPDARTRGYGVLDVQNGTSEDAVLSLYDSAADETVREVYVQAGHSVRMKGIPKGTYELAYTAGMDWDGGKATFRCDPDYAQFERDFAFTEERDQEGVQYHAITVTLHPVVGGNIRTKKISREEFLRNYRGTTSVPR